MKILVEYDPSPTIGDGDVPDKGNAIIIKDDNLDMDSIIEAIR